MRIKWVNTHKALRISTGTWYSFNKVNLQLHLLLSPCYWVKTFWSFYCLCFALRELLPAGRNHSLKLLFKECFPKQKAKLWNPNRDPSPGLWGTWPESQKLFCKSSMFFPARIRQVPILPRTGPPQPSSNSADHSRSHTQGSHSSPGWAPLTTAEVQPQGSPGEQETVRGGCICLPGSCRRGTSSRSSGDDVPSNALSFHRTPLSPAP